MPLVYALSVSREIEKIGSYAGFAAVLGLAVLALLYFSQAREVKRLREWAGRSPERAQELEQRVVEQAEAARLAASERRVVAQPQPKPALAPASAPGTPAGAAAAAGAAAGAGAAATATTPGAPGPAAPAATPPAGTPVPVAAPAVAGATAQATEAKPGEQADAKPDEKAGEKPITPPATPAAAPTTDGKPLASPATAPATVAGGAAAATPAAPERKEPSATNGSGESPPTVVAPPPAPIPTPAPVPARAAALRADAPSATIPPRPPAEPPRRGRENGDGGGRGWGTIGVMAATLAVVAGGAVLLITTLGGNDSPKQPNTPGQIDTTGSTGPTGSKTKSNKPVSRRDVVVAVLNGTTFTGLAADVANRIESAGFKKGAVTNAGDQTHSATLIQYASGFEKQARDIGRILKVTDAVEKLDSSTEAIACPPGECPTAQKPTPNVVVTVGADRTN